MKFLIYGQSFQESTGTYFVWSQKKSNFYIFSWRWPLLLLLPRRPEMQSDTSSTRYYFSYLNLPSRGCKQDQDQQNFFSSSLHLFKKTSSLIESSRELKDLHILLCYLVGHKKYVPFNIVLPQHNPFPITV